ncbi:MAG: response regulator [Phototrophicaceae bacterium]
MQDKERFIILIADDDPEDRMLVADALEEAHLSNELHFVTDGEDLMNYLFRKGRHEHLQGRSMPRLILLDLNMPKKDGREALAEIKVHPKFKSIPIVVMTTSQAESDIAQTYNLGANSFISKPVTFEGLVTVMKSLCNYWFNTVSLPSSELL